MKLIVNNDNDFEYYYSHIQLICINHLESTYPKCDFTFKSFYDASRGNRIIYFATYKIFDYSTLSTFEVNLTIESVDGKPVITHYNASSKA